jgi:hypothetical protein
MVGDLVEHLGCVLDREHPAGLVACKTEGYYDPMVAARCLLRIVECRLPAGADAFRIQSQTATGCGRGGRAGSCVISTTHARVS